MTTAEIRIEGALKNIEKSQNTLARHQARLQKKAEECKKLGIENPETWDRYTEGRTHEQYWAKCEYDSVQEDIENTKKKIQEYNSRLQYWRDKKKAEDKKNDIPVIPAIEEFLANWKTQADAYYRQQVANFAKWSKEYNNYYTKTMKELEETYGHRVHRLDKEMEEIKKSKKVNHSYRNEYIRNHFTQEIVFLYESEDLDTELNKMLDREVQNKRVDLYSRCSAVVGVITDASGLKVGENGSINGVVIGEDGKAKVETILAGGYAIQCLHYRVLVNPIKDTDDTEKSSESKEKSQPEKKFNYKEKSLQELIQMAKMNGVDYKEYSDERITRMRLVMALKKSM